MKYVELTEADAYFSMRMDSEPWEEIEESKKEKALTHAERVLDRISYKGLEVTAGFSFPRGTQTEIPTRFLEAIYEEALGLLQTKKNEQELSDLHVTSSSFAGFQTSVNEKIERPWVTHGLTSPIAWNLIAPYVRDTKSFRFIAD